MNERRVTIYKRGKRVLATMKGYRKKDGTHEFVFAHGDTHDALAKERIFAVDTESLTTAGELTTVLTPIRWHDGESALEVSTIGMGMLERVCRAIIDRYGVDSEQPSATKQRPRKWRKGSGRTRDGRRKTIEPCVAVFFNMPYDLGRLAADVPGFLRSTLAGADSWRVTVGAIEIEVARMALGSSSSFEWFIRDPRRRLIARVIGFDLTGYWKMSLAASAKSLGVQEKQSIPQEWYERPRESFSAEEWATFLEYGLGDVRTTLELYHATVLLLQTVDARVVRNTGIIPPSAPGAAARIAFALAFDQHPELLKVNGGPDKWPRPRQWVDQMGADAYYGGNVFSAHPGVYVGHRSLDIKSAYPHAMACLPDPVTAKYVMVHPLEVFDVDAWKGKYGVLYIDGECLDDIYPPLRVHDDEKGRLRFVVGKFRNLAATIPEIVIGVLRGALRVDRIRDGLVIEEATAETSFLRAAVVKFFAIKNDPENAPALQNMAKLLMNALYGKLVECTPLDYCVKNPHPIPAFTDHAAVARTIARIVASNAAPSEDSDYFGNTAAQVLKARRVYDTGQKHLADDESRTFNATSLYIEALEYADVPKGDGFLSVTDFLQGASRFRCGHSFLPVHGALITGMTSAKVGLMASAISAVQGDTDSVHFAMPAELGDDLTRVPGIARYAHILAESGYDIQVPGAPGLGSWMLESPCASRESVYVRPKVYSHDFGPDVDPKKRYKRATHGFARFPGDAAAVHDACKTLLTGAVTYTTKPSPRKMKHAVLRGQTIGEFVSSTITMNVVKNPRTQADENGTMHWLPLEDANQNAYRPPMHPRRTVDKEQSEELAREAQTLELMQRMPSVFFVRVSGAALAEAAP